MRGSRTVLAFGLMAFLCAIHPGCNSQGERAAVLSNPPMGQARAGENNATAGAKTDAGSGGAEGGADAGATTNCGEIACRGPGRCEVIGGFATCICDDGYRLADDGEQCVVDENCVKFRFLEDRCRVQYDGPPAVGLFFAVDFCAGTAVLPDKLREIADGFQILEDGGDVANNPESSARVIERDVESFVTLAVDVSGSVTDDEDLSSQLTRELRDFVEGLRAPSGEPPVGVSVMLFGIDVVEYVPFTTDLSVVDAALAELEDNPEQVLEQLEVRTNGTALHDAVNLGIRHTQRILNLREIVTEGGVLTTGTLVVVTDGRDTGGGDLDARLVDDTLVNLISIGISADIDDEDLTRIGRDGSFLAPEPADWRDAFDQIAVRVDQYPDRAYLLAYCSSANADEHEVTVRLDNDALDQASADCEFDASLFGVDFDDVCDAEFLESACDAYSCGGLFACGACADEECCSSWSCHTPQPTDDCNGFEFKCQPGGRACIPVETDDSTDVYECREYLGVGDACDNEAPSVCEPGISFCNDDDKCEASDLQTGDDCGDEQTHAGDLCPERNCVANNLRDTSQGYRCQRQARMFEPCSGNLADAYCELGAYCDSNRCAPQSIFNCNRDRDCASGFCGDESEVCARVGECHFDWSSRMGG